ncbi:glycosyltransferase family 4 protein [Modestobacter versicolor]|uniref:glycosyltransferase family 4 protein n=1 Tax=Modestobacter versicolor TaxID=429133 RepID=UPI0034DF888D
MRLLFVLARVNLPATSGDTVRHVALLRAARRVADRLDVVTLPHGDLDPAAPAGAAGDLVDDLVVVGEPMERYLRAPAERARSVLGRPYHDAVGRSGPLRRAVAARLAAHEYDAVVAGQLYVVSAVPAQWRSRTVFDTHNVETERTASFLALRGGPFRLAAPSVVAGVRRLERGAVRSSAVTIACSDHDAAQLRAMAPGADVRVVPNGADLPATPKEQRPDGRTALLLASLSSSANVDSLVHLVDDVLPNLPPDVVVQVAGSGAGRDAEAVLARAGGRVTFLGEVPDAREAMRQADVLLVPLRVGSGTRVKVLEAFALGLPVVATPKAVEGLPVRAGTHAAVAADPRAFAGHVVRLLDSVQARREMADAARELVGRTASWDAVTPAFVASLQDAAGR